MHGMGTVINTAAIVAGGILGRLFGRFLSESTQEALTKVCGVSTLFSPLPAPWRGCSAWRAAASSAAAAC